MDAALSILKDLYHLFRVSAFGATAVLPLLGAASAHPRLSLRQAAGLLGVAAAFHAFAYIHNDVCDLPLDRTQPRRAHYPMVRGALAPRTALTFALACVPLAFTLDRLLVREPSRLHLPDAPRAPEASLAFAFTLLAVYNRWGKRFPLPPLTDALQGLGWAALLHYGATATGRKPTRLTRLLELYELLLIVMVNGVHGALRDLENDAARGARTTAVLFGARVDAAGRLHVPPAMLAYALALQTALLALPAAATATSLAGHQREARRAAVAGVVAVSGSTLAVLALGARSGAASEAGMAHLVLLLSAPVALVAPTMPAPARALLLAAHLLPLLPNGMTYDALRWLLALRG